MRQDAFTGGVEPGGLRNRNDIRILLCYILSGVNGPLSKDDLSQIVQKKGLANYFEAEDALDALIRQGNAEVDGEGFCTVTPSGREIADTLDTSLPLSVRDKALEAALRLMAERRARAENPVDIEETESGYRVTCHITDGRQDMMTLSLYVPDRAQARLVEENFYKDPEGVYRLLLSSLTGDRDFIQSFLKSDSALF